jgi:Amt family ammonium transporter
VHAIGGIIGALLTGVFATKAVTGADAAVGWVDGNAGQVVTQFYGVATTIVYDAVVSFILLKIVDWTIGLRVSQDVERDGLDIALHGESVA